MIEKSKFQEQIGKQVKFLRVKHCLSQSELARRTNVSRTSITQLEGNLFMPTLYFTYKLASAFNITIDQLINL